MATPTASLSVLGLSLLLISGCRYLYITCGAAAENLSGSASGSWASNGISESSSGTLFRAVRVRTYSDSRLFAAWKPPPQPPAPARSRCKNWAVTTTIFAPTTTVKQIAALEDWCLVIAGDKKSPREYNVSGKHAYYLSPEAQEQLPFATRKLLRWNHFGRKNLGFLYAIQQGARWVYDTDDDNELQNLVPGIPIPRGGHACRGGRHRAAAVQSLPADVDKPARLASGLSPRGREGQPHVHSGVHAAGVDGAAPRRHPVLGRQRSRR